MKEKQFVALKADLDKISKGTIKTFSFYPFSNENNVPRVIEKLAERAPRKSKLKNRVAVVVGQSSFCSMLPELARHADIVLFADLNQKTLAHNICLLQAIKLAKTPKQFEQVYLKNALSFFRTRSEAKNALQERKELIGKNHFLCNLKRYKQCRDKAHSLRFATVRLDMLDEQQFSLFQEVLAKHKCEISFINVSNIFEYDSDCAGYWGNFSDRELKKDGFLLNNLKNITENPLIMYSIRKSVTKDLDLKAKLTGSFDRFVKLNQRFTLKTLNQSSTLGCKFKAVTPLYYVAKNKLKTQGQKTKAKVAKYIKS